MDTYNIDFFSQQFQENKEKMLELARLFQIAAKEVHAYVAAQAECRELRETQRLYSKEEMWRVFQNHLNKHRQQIQTCRPLLGITVIPVDQVFYEKLTIQDLQNQIELLIGAIYAIRAIKTSWVAFKECLKKMLRHNDLFSKKDIELILGK